MDNHQKTIKSFNQIEKRLLKYWAVILFASSTALILIVTLFPYTFTARNDLSLIMLLQHSFDSNIDTYDLISNVLLFITLGISIAGIFHRRFSSKLSVLMISLIISISLSLTVETMQIFLPQRTPSALDLVTNITGGVLGAGIFYLWKSGFQYLAKGWLTKKSSLTFMALSYGAFLSCLIFSLHHHHNLSNWDSTFPLLIGNEATGNRPWKGNISQVYFTNRSLSATEISQVFTEKNSRYSNDPWITAYQLTDKGDYPDQKGLAPDLEWRENPPQDNYQGMTPLTQQHWLLTSKPASKLIQAIQQTSQFSLVTTVATRDTYQTGPARIVSLSADPFRRNLTIGQEGSRLIVRLRTPLTGGGRTNTNLTFPGIFADTNSHKLLFNFNQKTLQLFVDGTERVSTLSLSPEILFFHFLPGIGLRNFQVTPMNQWILKLVFYGLFLLLPITLLLVLIRRKIVPRKS